MKVTIAVPIYGVEKYIERCAVYDVKHINQAKAAIKKALTYQK